MKIIEPTVVRLTSEETRMLMQAACNPQGVSLGYRAQGVLTLGLIRETKRKTADRTRLRREMNMDREKALACRSWKALLKAMQKAEKSRSAFTYYSKPEKLYVLTEAGRKLVSDITIRRR